MPAAVALAAALLFPAGAYAQAPGEVTNLQSSTNGTLSWNSLSGAAGYNIYRGDVASLRQGNYGACLTGSVQGTSSPVPGDPLALGSAVFFLVSGENESGEGPVSSSPGANPSPRCIAARRFFASVADGDAGDGLSDGVAPLRNPDILFYPSHEQTAGVFLHSGELFVSASDLISVGRDRSESVGPDRSISIDSDRGESIGGGGSLSIGGSRSETVGGDGSLSIGGSRLETVGGNRAPSIGGSRSESVGGATGRSGATTYAGKHLHHGSNASCCECHCATMTTQKSLGKGPSQAAEFLAGGVLLPFLPESGDPHGPRSGSFRHEHQPAAVGAGGEIETDKYGRIKVQFNWDHLGTGHESSSRWVRVAGHGGWGGGGPTQRIHNHTLELSRSDPEDEYASHDTHPDCVFCHAGGNRGSSGALSAGYLVQRSYRSQVHYDGPLGQGWDFPANARLAPSGGNAVYFDGSGRQETWTRIDASHFATVPGRYAVLFQNGNGTFTLRDRDGSVQNFHAFDGSNLQGVLESAQDRVGNRTAFLYDSQGLLTDLVDPLGRDLHYAYNAQGRIATITDFAGRQVVYTYDGNGNLTSVRSPIVTGTPNGNDFPAGRTTQYAYSSGFADPRLNNNLIGVIRPDESGSGIPAIQVAYGSGGAAFNFDRVVSETIGGTNSSGVAAGGTMTFSYQALNPGADPSNLALPRRQTTLLDRNGNQKQFVHNAGGNCLTLTEFTNRSLRPGEPDYTTQFSYNADGELILVLRPQGDQTQLTYDRPGADRYREGNLILVRSVADTHSSGGRGDGHGGESNDRVWTFTYEPIFNQLASATDPRGNDASYIPQNGGTTSPSRYTRTWTYDYQEGDPLLNGINAYAGSFGISLNGGIFGVGDANGDGILSQIAGNPVRISGPSVQLDPAAMQAAIQGGTLQPIETKIEWNSHGEPTALTDAELNRHTFQYTPESDPDGDGTATPPPLDGRVLDTATGGFLKTENIDTISAPGRDNSVNPGPPNIQLDLKYDPMGNLAALIDGRGVETKFIQNALNEVVEIREAAATADASGPDGTSPTGRGEAGLTAFGFLERFAYDADGNVVTIQSEDRGATRGVGTFVTDTRTFDILGDLVQEALPATATTTLTTHFLYDPNQNPTRVTEPDGNSHDAAYDERDLLLSSTRGATGPLGGTPSTRRYDYDGDGDLTRLTDGRGGITDFLYDGHDRPVRSVDPVGGTVDLFYDPAGSQVRLLARGTSGGATPQDRSGGGNVDLADLRLLYDEESRPFREDRLLFVPAGVSPVRPPMITEGSLLPGDGAVNTIFEYDRLSRLTFLHDDNAALSRLDYDGAGRMIKSTDPAGDTVDWTYDASGNAIESTEDEVSTKSPGPPQEQFLTTFFYDSLNRPVMAVDNIGETSRALYDSLYAVTTASDANGPAGGSISRRSPGHTGMTVPINSHGNVTRFAYDGAGRLLTSARVLTASGKGDGTISPAPDTSNPANPDGLITSTRSWSGNGLLLQILDDKGNPTTYAYDNLDRKAYIGRSDGFIQQIGYDGEDAVQSGVDPNGSTVTASLDPAGRTIQRSIAAGPGVAGTSQQAYEYDGLSRITRAVDPNLPTDSTDDTNVTFVYDSLGRLLEEAQQPSGTGGGPARASDLAWQGANRLTGLTYPDGDQVMYGYDGAGRLRIMNDLLHPELMASFDYFGMGRLESRTLGNGVSLTFLDNSGTIDTGYDGARRPVLMRHLDSSGSLLAGFEYRYDRVGSVTSTRRLHDFISGGACRGNVYAYDSAGRLVSALVAYLDANHNVVSTPSDQEAWRLDGPGNWANLTRNGTLYNNTPNNLNEYDEAQCCGAHSEDGVPDDFLDNASTPIADGLNLTYDRNGNQTDTVRQSISYNFANLPVGALDLTLGAPVAAYAYDALGRRTKRVVTGGEGSPGTSLESHAGGLFGDAIEEDGASGSLLMQHAVGPGGGCIWHLHGDGSSQYALEDAFGSGVALVPGLAAGGGGVLERVVYDPYGKPTFEDAGNNPLLAPGGGPFLPESQYGNDHLFLGMHYDPELGARGTSVNWDFGGLYAAGFAYNPNEGRSMDVVPGDLVAQGPGPISSPANWMAQGPGPIQGPGYFTPIDIHFFPSFAPYLVEGRLFSNEGTSAYVGGIRFGWNEVPNVAPPLDLCPLCHPNPESWNALVGGGGSGNPTNDLNDVNR